MENSYEDNNNSIGKYENSFFYEDNEDLKMQRRDNIMNLQKYFKALDLTHETTFLEAQNKLYKFKTFQNNKNLFHMDKEDVLIAFQEFIEGLEAKQHHVKIINQINKIHRQERKNRQYYFKMLHMLNQQGKLKSNTSWKNIRDEIFCTAEFYKIMEQKGSTALDLFKFFIQDLKGIVTTFQHEERCKQKEINQKTTKNTKILEKFIKCIPCNIDFINYDEWKKHCDDLHKRVRKLFALCLKCNKEFLKVTLKRHIYGCFFERIDCRVPNCNRKYAHLKGYKLHIREFHGKVNGEQIKKYKDEFKYITADFVQMKFIFGMKN